MNGMKTGEKEKTCMNIQEVVQYINSHADPVLTPEMNALVMETCYQVELQIPYRICAKV